MAKTVYLVNQYADGLMESLGLENRIVPVDLDFRRFTNQLIEEGIALVFVSEGVYQKYHEWIELYHDSLDISFIVLAGLSERDQVGMNRLNASVEEAIGIKIGGQK